LGKRVGETNVVVSISFSVDRSNRWDSESFFLLLLLFDSSLNIWVVGISEFSLNRNLAVWVDSLLGKGVGETNIVVSISFSVDGSDGWDGESFFLFLLLFDGSLNIWVVGISEFSLSRNLTIWVDFLLNISDMNGISLQINKISMWCN
jgi:hypothetical protein